MPLDTRIPMLMGQMRPIRFQPETQMESLAAIAPAVNAMRQLQAGQFEAAEAQRKRRAFQEFQTEVSRAFPGGVKELAQVLITRGTMPQHFEMGQKLMEAAMQQEENQRLFAGVRSGGAAVGMPAPATPAAPTMAQMPVSEVAPEMAKGAAGGAQPRNAMMAMEMPAPAARPAAAAPAGMLEYGGSFYPPEVVQGLLASRNAQHQQLGRAIAEANRPQRETQPEKLRMMQALGFPMTAQGLADFEATQRSQQMPADYQNYLQAKKEGYAGNFFQYQQELRKAGASSVSVDAKAESAERVERAKQLVKDYNDVATAARVARRSLMSIEGAQGVLNRGFSTGFGTETIAKAASVLAALGVPSAEKYATSAQTFLSEARKVLLDRQLEQKGPQTENDAKRIDESFVRLGNTPEANKFILAVAKAQAEQSSEQQKFYDAFYRRNKTYDGAEEAWLAGDGSKSIFQRPSLRSFVVPSAAAPSGRPPLDQIIQIPTRR